MKHTTLSASDFDSYFQRIGHSGDLQADLKTLTAIHKAHALAIPFENLSIFMGQPIPIDLASVCHKLIHTPRGGYCFEMNTLLFHILLQIGFQVEQLQGRVWIGTPLPEQNPQRVPPRGHKLLLVTLNDGTRYLADVGFGGPGLVRPLQLAAGIVQVHPEGAFRLLPYPGLGYLLQRADGDGQWTNLYSFDMNPCFAEDFEFANYFVSTHPLSYLFQNRVVVQPTPTGRLSLCNRQLTRLENGVGAQETIESPEAYRTLLAEAFKIVLNDVEAERLLGPLFAPMETVS